MNLFKSFSGLFKREVTENKEFVLSRYDARAFYNTVSAFWNERELLDIIGGYDGYSKLTNDPEIFAALDKRIAALLDTKLQIKGKDERLTSWFEDQLLPHENQLKQDFWWTMFNGWGVEQIIYNENGSGEVTGFQREEFWRFQPLEDLIHARINNPITKDFEDNVLPYGKFVVTTNNGTSYNPNGDPLAFKLITPWLFMCTSDDLWLDFAKRFANGFMHAKIEDEEQQEVVKRALESAAKSSIIVTDKNSELELSQPNRDSSLYIQMSEMATRRIQKVILGETQTSGMEVRGSSASATIHNEVRLEKTRADIKLVEAAINETILQIALVNGFIPDASYESELPKAKIIYDPEFNLELASRDSTLRSMGVKFSKDYYVKNYGFEPEDFELEEIQPQVGGFFNQKKRTFLSSKDIDELMPTSRACCPIKLDNTQRKGTRIAKEIDEIVELVDRNIDLPINTEDLIAAMNSSESEEELNEKLLALYDNRNNKFVDTMTEALYLSAARGAMVGNPEVVSEKK